MTNRWAPLASALLLLAVSVLPVSAAPAPAPTDATTAYRVVTPPPSMPDLRGVVVRVPVNMEPIPPDMLWNAVARAEEARKANRIDTGDCDVNPEVFCVLTFPSWWASIDEVTQDHAPWKLGSTATNETSTEDEHSLSVSAHFGVKVAMGLPTDLLVALGLDIESSVDVDETQSVTISPNTSKAIWATAWRDVFKVRIHKDYLCLRIDGTYTVVEGGHITGKFYIPIAGAWDTTEFCVGCSPKRPSW